MTDNLPAYEKLGVFYLGRPYDLTRGETAPAPLLYDSRDLVTHAVCMGMTGSGSRCSKRRRSTRSRRW